MAELSTLARPYAKAAFSYANDAGQTAQWEEYLAFASGLLDDAAFADYLTQPSRTQAQQLDAIVTVSNNSFPDNFKNFLTQLVEHERLPALPAILEEYQALKSAADQETVAVIESAFELSAAETTMMQEALERRYGNKVSIETVVNPELIAGAVIRVGDQVIDDSALGRLKQLKNTLSV